MALPLGFSDLAEPAGESVVGKLKPITSCLDTCVIADIIHDDDHLLVLHERSQVDTHPPTIPGECTSGDVGASLGMPIIYTRKVKRANGTGFIASQTVDLDHNTNNSGELSGTCTNFIVPTNSRFKPRDTIV